MRHLVVFVYFVAGVVTFILFVYFKFEKYFCYIWILTFVMSYPILFYFSKKGDCFVNNLSEQEMNKYNNISKNMLYAIGVFIIIGTFANKYLNMVDFDLDGEISVISTVLYLIWGGMCLGYAVMSE